MSVWGILDLTLATCHMPQLGRISVNLSVSSSGAHVPDTVADIHPHAYTNSGPWRITISSKVVAVCNSIPGLLQGATICDAMILCTSHCNPHEHSLCNVIVLIGQGSIGCIRQLLLVLRLLHGVNDHLWGLQCHLLHKVQVGVPAYHTAY